MTIWGAFWLQPQFLTYVNRIVEKMNAAREEMLSAARRRFVKVMPPMVHAGVGNALRRAFHLDGEMRSLAPFDDLLRQLD